MCEAVLFSAELSASFIEVQAKFREQLFDAFKENLRFRGLEMQYSVFRPLLKGS